MAYCLSCMSVCCAVTLAVVAAGSRHPAVNTAGAFTAALSGVVSLVGCGALPIACVGDGCAVMAQLACCCSLARGAGLLQRAVLLPSHVSRPCMKITCTSY